MKTKAFKIKHFVNTITSISFLLFLVAISSCKKFSDVGVSKTELNSEKVFNDIGLTTAALMGIYSTESVGPSFISPNLSRNCGLSADELTDYSNNTSFARIYTNSLVPGGDNTSSFWGYGYKAIIRANFIIEGLQKSTGINESQKKQLIGEAKFLRAFYHFYLVNLYGSIPYVTSTDYKANNTISQLPASEVYSKIIADLNEAQNSLPQDYMDGKNIASNERVRPNKAAAIALLARVYLYSKDYTNAELNATSVIENSATYTILDNLDGVFLKNSKESIWQLMADNQYYTNGQEAYNFVLTSSPASSPGRVAIPDAIVNDFENGDLRKKFWINTFTQGGNTWYYSYKYKTNAFQAPTTQYTMVLRLAEQYLIRAEARINQNKLQDAIKDIDVIRRRAGLLLISTTNPNASKDELMTILIHERKMEFLNELGHRWLDLKRLNLANTVLGTIKGPNWQTTDQLYPIAFSELTANPNLRQNPGYPGN